MYRFSYKVNQRRRIRQTKRQLVHYIIAPDKINRWCSHIDKKTIIETDNKLQHLCIPHNMKVVFLESNTMASQ